MLTASISGRLFSSPPSSNILSTIMNVARLNEGGVFVIILNYSGDVLNFGVAIEEAKTRGVKIASVIVGDDCSMTGSHANSSEIRRGLCGIILLIKIIGGMSTAGRPLKELDIEARAICCRMLTMGVCVAPCSMPGVGHPHFTMDDNTIGFGIGIHGEAGTTNIKMCTAQKIVELLLRKIVDKLILNKGFDLCVLINNLGSVTNMESFIIAMEVKKQLVEMGYNVVRIYVGTFVSSLNMKGIQVTVLNVHNRNDWLSFLDLNTEAFGWTGCELSSINKMYPQLPISFKQLSQLPEISGLELSEGEALVFKGCLKNVCSALKDKRLYLNKLDSGCGDADLGNTFSIFSEATLKTLHKLTIRKVPTCLLELSKIADSIMGGTTGALYSLMLLGAAKNALNWTTMFTAAVKTLMQYSLAKIGDRSMVDSLLPACGAYKTAIKESKGDWRYALHLAVEKAEEGCEKTRNMIPKIGRAIYVAADQIKDVDAGAYAVVLWLKSIESTLLNIQSFQTSAMKRKNKLTKDSKTEPNKQDSQKTPDESGTEKPTEGKPVKQRNSDKKLNSKVKKIK